LRPDGSLIYLIEAGDDIYTRDFHLHDAPTLRDDYSGIDHLALGMEADSRDNWITFFRTVFGFTLEHEQTLPDPYGLVRSLAVHSPQGNIRLALNISQSRATQIARSVACYQGQACSTRRLPAHLPARRLLRSPFRRCRFRLITMMTCWRAMARRWTSRRCNVCIFSMTAIRAAGRFLHLYTRPFSAGRFFFELTERRDGYALYGAANAAVRLSAMQYS
jgi:4-hydroxyphenylpyruvate dioxygenase